jgi:hypothetical protein
MRTKLDACSWCKEEQPAGLKNPQAMPACLRHDKSLPLLDHGFFGRIVVIDGSEKTSFKHTEYFIALGMVFPMVGVHGIIVGEVDNPQNAVDRRIAELSPRVRNTSSAPVFVICNQAILQAEGGVVHGVSPLSIDIHSLVR